MIKPKTIEGLEREFEIATNHLDGELMSGQLDQELYDKRSRDMAKKFDADVAALPRNRGEW
jgi:hypothetical protein